ncbi:MAG: hypothetical protein PF795_14595 [Kiritimatiellae bacterium]|nr:hypothetical protein [Kiritimatiellia bacterium]
MTDESPTAMYHSGHPRLRAKAETWINAAPPGLLIRGSVPGEGWGHWIPRNS